MLLHEKKEMSFSELVDALEIDTGKMSFHLRNLRHLVERAPSGKYVLSQLGEKALEIIQDVKALSVDADFLEHESERHLARFRLRAVAFLFDMGAVFTVMVALVLLAEFFVLFTGQFLFHQNIFLFLFLLWLYSTLLEGYGGQTLGKIVLSIKVVNLGSKRVSYDAAAVRSFGKCFLLPFDLLFGLRLKDKRFMRFFDKYSRTTVIRL